MPTYLSPGVYIEEREGGTRPIEAVGTAVAAFVGFTEKAEDRSDGQVTSLQNRPVAITNWTQYTEKFGGFVEGAYLPYSVYGYFLNGGSRCYVVSVKTLGASVDEKLATPAAAMLPARAETGGDTLEIKSKSGGPTGNSIKVTVRDPEDAAAETFTLIIAAPEGTETFNDLTLSKGEQNVETVVNTRSQFVVVQVKQAKGTVVERRPKAGEYALQGGKIETMA
ncbi:MAG: phage tail sheath family protein, partial [Anaerolineae bacterium]